MNAVIRPFTDFKKLLIGILLNIIPVINFFALGYLLECGRTPKKDLPEWKNFGDFFVEGFFAAVIALILTGIGF